MTGPGAPLGTLTLSVPAAFCDECGNPFPLTAHAKSRNQILCAPRCNAIRHKRRMREASKIIKACLVWRLDRTKDGLRDLTFLLDNGLIDQERKVRALRDENIAAFKKDKTR